MARITAGCGSARRPRRETPPVDWSFVELEPAHDVL
uniref:Uncharacterized protein n=1 Tax=Setaria italica TaxID=4555 RepID=K4APD6_SETIT